MKQHIAACGLLLSLFLGAAASEEPVGPNKLVPELQLLQRWAGKWDLTMTYKVGNKGEQADVTGTATGKWVLNGYFLEQKYSLGGKGASLHLTGTVTMSYDPSQNLYQRWVFVSNGHRSESLGKWDEKSRTMTWSFRQANGVTIVTRVTCTDDDTETWTEVILNPDEKIISEMSGKNTRRKP
jgi:hypothetical protein